MAPPGLAWLDQFSTSTGLALDASIVADAQQTVNALTYKIRVRWTDRVDGKVANQVWNLFQKWCTSNKTVPSGRVQFARAMVPAGVKNNIIGFDVDVYLRERLGHPKKNEPK